MAITFTQSQLSENRKPSSFPFITSAAPLAPCAPIAIRVITGAPEEKIVEILDRECPNWRRRGTPVYASLKCFEELGFKHEKITLGKQSRKRVDRVSFSEVEFALRYRTGTYFVCTVNHAYVMHNQHVIDCLGKRNTRRITNAYRIEKDEECLSTEKVG